MTTLADFKTRILNNMGDGFHVVELTDPQFTNVYRRSMKRMIEMHYDGAKEQVYVLTLTSGTTEYTLPSNIHSVTGYYKADNSAAGGTPSWRKLFLERNMTSIALGNIMDYSIFTAYMRDIDITFGQKHLFSFNKNTKKLQFLNTQGLNDIALEVWIDNSIDDSEYLHDDEFFEEFVTQKCILQWCMNLKKYSGELLSGTTVNWQEMEQTAREELEKLEQRMKEEYMEVYDIMIG